MSNWRPTADAATARRRAALLARAREYFSERDVLAVDTPALGAAAASDPNIESLEVRFLDGRVRYLHTSPEFCMKRLLAAGYPDIYSISRVFRDGEAGSRHVAEFTLLEWYRLGFGLEAIIEDTLGAIARCLDRPALAGSAAVHEYADALAAFAGVDAFAASADELAGAAGADAGLRAALGEDRDAWLDLVLSTAVAPRFEAGTLTVLRHYPASQAALARICPADARVADRFEVFLGGLELANGYVELTDAGEQRRRIEADRDARRRRGQPVNPRDDRLLDALGHGLPACAGVAVGVERLHMVADGAAHIRDVLCFCDDDRDRL